METPSPDSIGSKHDPRYITCWLVDEDRTLSRGHPKVASQLIRLSRCALVSVLLLAAAASTFGQSETSPPHPNEETVCDSSQSGFLSVNASKHGDPRALAPVALCTRIAAKAGALGFPIHVQTRIAVRFALAEKSRSPVVFGQLVLALNYFWTTTVPTSSCSRASSVLTSDGNQHMKLQSASRHSSRRPTLLLTSPLFYPAVRGSRSTARESRYSEREPRFTDDASLLTNHHSRTSQPAAPRLETPVTPLQSSHSAFLIGREARVCQAVFRAFCTRRITKNAASLMHF